MDLTSDIFTSILSPLAAFLPPAEENPTPNNPDATTATSTTTTNPTIALKPWHTSPLNPQSRLDSLGSNSATQHEQESNSNYTWQIDGTDPTGRRFYATPRFALHKPPLRVDVYLPPVEAWPARLREVVRPERAVYFPGGRHAGAGAGAGAATGGDDGEGGGGVAGLEVGRWLGGVLSRWQRGMDSSLLGGVSGELEKRWWSLPFGSVIAVDVGLGVGREEVSLLPEYGVEQRMLGVEVLKRMWEGEVDAETWEGVQVVEWERLRFRKQVHEVISLVSIDGVSEGKELAFKCVLQEQGYMYNELKMLLSLQPHSNIISQPVGVVTRKGRFGNRRGVCGFLLEWLPLGSLRERLLWNGYEEHTSMGQRLRWARQVTEAFVHVNGLANAGFYPDLKPDNVILKENPATGMLDAVLIDFEQRGGWFAWSPPEVKYLEYLEILADDSGLPDGDLKRELLGGLRAYYDNPDWLPGTSGRGRYHNTKGGFSSPWLALLERRKTNGEDGESLEQAQVFMLGKLLWCIFEGQPLVRCGIDHEMLRDSDPEYESKRSGRARAFPEFKKTPPKIRQLIRTCTAGAPEWEDGVRLPAVVIRKGKFYPAMSGPDLGAVTAVDTLNAARSFWGHEVERARAFMQTLLLLKSNPQDGLSPTPVPLAWLDQARTRPRFARVLEELGQIESSLRL
jgi:hypothetical protein